MLSKLKLIPFLWILMIPTAGYAEDGDLPNGELIHLLHDQPMYFLFGAPQVKAQLSFKVKLLKATDVYFAYTQKIFWDIFEKSSPFRDLNYIPSAFYRFRFQGSESSLDFIGWEHESNGKGDRISRSWNRVGARFQSSHRLGNGSRLTWNVRAWVPYGLDESNRNIAEYRGLYEVMINFSDFLGEYFVVNDLTLRFYPGGKTFLNPFQGGRELTFRLRGSSPAFITNVVFQLFEGYGENMLEYDQHVWGIRAGIGL